MTGKYLSLVPLVALVGAGGCKERTCTGMAGASGLVEQAQYLRLDVYDGDVGCNGGQVARDAKPSNSRGYHAGEKLSLDVGPGMRTVQLTAFSDPEGTQIIGTACQVTSFGPGGAVCLDLMLSPPGDASVNDLSLCANDACSCTMDADCTLDRHCETGHCVLGCHDNGGCAPAAPLCDTAQHKCLECRGDQDCAGGKHCSPSGTCVESCDPQKGIGCPSGLACCSGFCIDILKDPLNCGMCGKGCFGATGTCCNGLCSDLNNDPNNCGGCGAACSTVNATPSCSVGNCAWSCANGFAHCGSGNTGCATDTTTTANCGGCGKVCDTSYSVGATCNGTTCIYSSCQANSIDCDQTAPNTDGCESKLTSTKSCGGCGNACDTTNSAPQMCNGTKCIYATCLNKHANCDTSGADTNGCECESGPPLNGCCGSACATKHSDGIGGNFFDCAALGTITQQEAMAACQATYAATAGIWNCVVSNCGTGSPSAVCADQSHPTYGCPCWNFVGVGSGHVKKVGCACATSTDPTWN